jgi:hypothetical protein
MRFPDGVPRAAALEIEAPVLTADLYPTILEWAGTAAVQAIQMGQLACDLDTALRVTTLRCQGAYLPQKTLSGTMTRS